MGGASVICSHHTSPSGVSAQLVKIEFFSQVRIAFGLVFMLVPGATPKKPASGLIACRRPSAPHFIHAMSSPTVSTFQPRSVGVILSRLVLPHAEGKAAALEIFFPSRPGHPRNNMSSASQ